MRILVLGSGVIGSVYAGKLVQAGHEVVMLARVRRLADLQSHGLLLEDAESGNRTAQPVASVNEPRQRIASTWLSSLSGLNSSRARWRC